MATTYEAIATVTVGSGGASSVSFTSIPNTYTDLKLVLSLRQDVNNAPNDGGIATIEFNSAGTSNFSGKILRGFGSGTGSFSAYLNLLYYPSNPSDFTSNTFSNAEIYVPNYNSSTGKSFALDAVVENNATTCWNSFQAGLWDNTSAITSISVATFTGGAKFVQYSTATLYGIKNS